MSFSFLLPFTISRPSGNARRISRLVRRQLHSQSKTVIQELDERGFIAALTSPKLKKHVESPTTIYAGVDPSASSLHVGNLLPLLGLLHFQAKGHQSICLIGGATGSIGDPSGRSTERKSLSPEDLAINVKGITDQVHRFFRTGSAYLEKRGVDLKGKGKEVDMGVKVVDNYEWTKDLSLLDFLRGPGKLSRVGVMLARDSVKNRLTSDSGISYTEFTYQLLQAYDFSHLWNTYGCRIQMGGSDQWGNIVSGIDLIKRSQAQSHDTPIQEDEEVEAYGMTIPLLTTSSGEKFGKSAGNAVWLDEARTSPAEFYQFFLRTTDEDVSKYLKLFTFLSIEQIDKVMAEHETSKSARIPQKLLAAEVTELVHGPSGLHKALLATSILYPTKPDLSSLHRTLKSQDVLAAFEGDSRFHKLPFSEIIGIPISKLCVIYGLCKSRGEASKLISQGSLFVNDRKINDPRDEIVRSNLVDGRVAILRVGVKKHLIFYVE
ncbi:tyrosine-tRNA ligase [Kwoniella bestiolae CBS 10118]|uniref:Tyrosine--tRNA ligase n=1 Tax=Kwoniella bestiolae CBS 10118 TaxID=1296100 RepID=A0A1B9G422_9TREE|nr:tyrosine-tRNA ligase [Kwoniella bestiolae CBS 10118]OCF25766.1 tyrosine-tRNA ligase [Kwoniella bestiolae CBS 10118]